MPTFKYKFKNVFPSQMESNLCGLDMKIVILFSVNSSAAQCKQDFKLATD